MRSTAFLVLLVMPRILAACSCVISQSVCQESAGSSLVFVGTVEAVQSALMPDLKFFLGSDWRNDPEIMKLKSDKSESALRALKNRYLKLLAGLPGTEKVHIESAATQVELQSIVHLTAGRCGSATLLGRQSQLNSLAGKQSPI